jgi:hypothetical protein
MNDPDVETVTISFTLPGDMHELLEILGLLTPDQFKIAILSSAIDIAREHFPNGIKEINDDNFIHIAIAAKAVRASNYIKELVQKISEENEKTTQ